MIRNILIIAPLLLSMAYARKTPPVAETIPREPVCEISVDFNKDTGLVKRNASGILHSFHAQEPPDGLVVPLKLKAFRIPDTGTQPLGAPLEILDETIKVSGKDLSLNLPDLAPGEVISIEIQNQI
ncbi:hypothetical protein JW926_03640 [Candidatus Sumerlaeota bacterium]|nr:hypothetical protein [Candidatus Sumerlaeota bacterium]